MAPHCRCVSKQLHPFQQEVDQIAVENTVVIIGIMGNIHPDDFLEEVTGEFQGIRFCGFLLICVHAVAPGDQIVVDDVFYDVSGII